MSNEIEEFRKAIDLDENYQAKRKLLVVVCLIFIAMNLSGAKLEEANTFIFKLTFENTSGISFFFLLAVAFLTLRYYQYARRYHDKLYDFWTASLLSDYRFINISPYDDDQGLLSGLIPEKYSEKFECGNVKYLCRLFLVRKISYLVEVDDRERGRCSQYQYISLKPFKKGWSLKKHYQLIRLELNYQLGNFLNPEKV